MCLACPMAPGSTELVRPLISAGQRVPAWQGDRETLVGCALGVQLENSSATASSFGYKTSGSQAPICLQSCRASPSSSTPEMTPGMCPPQGTLNPLSSPHRGICRQQCRLGPPGCSVRICPQSPLLHGGVFAAAPEHRHCCNGTAQPPCAQPSRWLPCSPHGMGLPWKTRSRWSRCLSASGSAAVFTALVPWAQPCARQEVEPWQMVWGSVQGRKGWQIEQLLGAQGSPGSGARAGVGPEAVALWPGSRFSPGWGWVWVKPLGSKVGGRDAALLPGPPSLSCSRTGSS